jgi:hypothetical protein
MTPGRGSATLAVHEKGGVVAVLAHPKLAPVALPKQPDLRVIESKRRAAKLHLLTYVVGNALFWTLWAAVSVSADTWYWWLVVPFLGWTLVLALHLGHAFRART